MAKQIQETVMVIATLYSASITNGKFNKDHKDMVHGPKAVKRLWAQDFNIKAAQSGKFYEFDEDATLEFYIKAEEKKKERDEAAALKAETGSLLVEAVKSIKKPKKK